MHKAKIVAIKPSHAGQRLDNYLFAQARLVPKSRIYRAIRAGEIRINKGRCRPSSRLNLNDQVRLPPWMVAEMAQKQDQRISGPMRALSARMAEYVIAEDEQFLILNKPAGIAVHGGTGLDVSMVGAISLWRDDLSDIHPVHRIDRGTSGVWVLAKDRGALLSVHAQLRERSVEKVYHCFAHGQWTGDKQKNITLPLKKVHSQADSHRVYVDEEEGDAAETQFTLLKQFENCCLVEARPKTGRMHQIRVHALALGHPIVGDEKYADAKYSPIQGMEKRMYLHARSIQFEHPALKKPVQFEAEYDTHFEDALGR